MSEIVSNSGHLNGLFITDVYTLRMLYTRDGKDLLNVRAPLAYFVFDKVEKKKKKTFKTVNRATLSSHGLDVL